MNASFYPNMPKVISKQTKTDRKLKLSNFRWATVQPPISGEVCGLHFLHPGLSFKAALEDRHQWTPEAKISIGEEVISHELYKLRILKGQD